MKLLNRLLVIFFICLTCCTGISAAEVVIAEDMRTRYGDLPRKNIIAFTSDQVGYVFYTDTSYNLVYKKTTDGGVNWGSKIAIHNIASSNGHQVTMVI